VERISAAPVGSLVTEPKDHGSMYASSFYDPDGHHREFLWLDPSMDQE
jgi:predicted lactoylglutathione lyase